MELIKKIKESETKAQEIIEQAKADAAKQAEKGRESRLAATDEAAQQRKKAVDAAVAEAHSQASAEVEQLKAQAQQQRQQLRDKTGSKMATAADKVMDYFLIIAGDAGDSYIIFDGGEKKCIGEFIASRVYVEHRRYNEMPVIYAYLFKPNGSVQYVCYMHDKEKYIKVSSSYLYGEILEKLNAKLAKYVRVSEPEG